MSYETPIVSRKPGSRSRAHDGRVADGAASRRGASAPSETLQFVWEHHRAETLEHVGVIEQAHSRLSAGELEEPLRVRAQRAAHMLAGSVGTFGFMHASALARELELELANAADADPQETASLVAELRRELEGETTWGRGSQPDERESEAPRVLVVTSDAEAGERIRSAGAAHPLECDIASDASAARTMITLHSPAAVVLDLTCPPQDLEDAYTLLSELGDEHPDVAVLVLTGSDEFTDRVEAVRRGSRAFLSKSLQPNEILSAVEQLLAGERLAATRVLVVDDDPIMLEALRALLRPHDIAISTLADPTRFWATLKEVEPELVILDLDMPSVNGVELCRTVRSDARWSSLAVIFVTASTDPATVELVFNAGADDYVAKPIVGPELVTRVSNRLERVRLLRAQAELDGLTGLSNRVTSEQRLGHVLSLSDRFEEPLCVAFLDVDRFKQVNDTHGHAAGDEVLRRLGGHLKRAFRGYDVVGRWGGEEFVIGMYAMTRENAERRLADLLQGFSEEHFEAAGKRFSVTFSAGLAERGRDGEDIDTLCEAADRALYRAKAAGRGRVLTAA